MGTNLLMVMPSGSRVGGVSQGAGTQNSLTLEDVDKLRAEGTLFAAITPTARSSGQIIGGGANWSTQVQGVSPEFLEARSWSVETGDMFEERDLRARAKVAVLGKTVADQLFGGQSPVGAADPHPERALPGGRRARRQGQNAFGQDQDDLVLAPVTTVLYRLSGRVNVDQILVSAATAEATDRRPGRDPRHPAPAATSSRSARTTISRSAARPSWPTPPAPPPRPSPPCWPRSPECRCWSAASAS